jgi:hypothetical protein
MPVFMCGAHAACPPVCRAHWCPPCRAFTPALARYYAACWGRRPNALEIVFVSRDRDAHSFDESVATPPPARRRTRTRMHTRTRTRTRTRRSGCALLLDIWGADERGCCVARRRTTRRYFATMPWVAVPFEAAGLRDGLARSFGVRGIPALILLGAGALPP